MCCTPTVRLLIVLTLPPRYRCPLNRYRPLGSCPRAAGWSAATLCFGAKRPFAEWGSYGMSAFDGKEDTEGLGSIWARSHPEDCQPPKTSRPLILPFKLTSVTRAL